MKDIIKQINLRISSPFIFSFIVSWLFINWPIPVGLFWYNGETIKQFGYDGHAALIEQNTSFRYNIACPTIVALMYMAVTPVINYFNALYVTWVKKQQTRHVTKISEKSYITVGRYIKLQSAANKQTSALRELIENEEIKFAEKEKTIGDLNNSLSEHLLKNKLIKKVSNSTAIEGDWLIKITHDLGHPSLSQVQVLKGNTITIKDNRITRTSNDDNVALINAYLYASEPDQIGIEFRDVDGLLSNLLSELRLEVFTPILDDQQNILELNHVYKTYFSLKKV